VTRKLLLFTLCALVPGGLILAGLMALTKRRHEDEDYVSLATLNNIRASGL
jgi:hypothetical protein